MVILDKLKTNTIYNEDCLDLLPKIPDKTFDCVLTDPPYGLNYMSTTGQFDKITNDDVLFAPIEELWRVTKNDGCILLFFSHKIPLIDDKIKQILFWIKNNHTRGNYKSNFANIIECIAFIPKPDFQMKRFATNVLKCDIDDTKSYIHPTQKPVGLITNLIESVTKKDNLILDCFFGSGSTGVSCLTTNRKFIGIEINKNYYDIANKRLLQYRYDSDKNNYDIPLIINQQQDENIENEIIRLIKESDGFLSKEDALILIKAKRDLNKQSIKNKR